MNQIWESKKNPIILDPILACLVLIWAHKIFLEVLPSQVVDIVPTYHPMQFTGKLMNQIWENNKPNFGLDFGLFGPNLGLQNFFWGFYLY